MGEGAGVTLISIITNGKLCENCDGFCVCKGGVGWGWGMVCTSWASINFQGRTLLHGDSYSLRECQEDETCRIVGFRNPYMHVTVFSHYLAFHSPRLM